MCSRLGYPREELLTMTVHDIISEEHRKKMAGIGQELSKSGECTFIGEHRKKDGAVFPVEVKIHRFTLFNKRVVLATARDISDRKLAEEMLRESEAKYRTIIEQSHDGIFIAQEGLLVLYNPALIAMTGYSSDELYRRSIADLIAPEDRELVLNRHRERSSGHVLPEVYEFSLLHHDGTGRIRVTMNVTSASIGGRPATIGTLHNVTEEREREEELRVSEEKYRSVITNFQDMFYRTDKAGNLIMASPSCLSKLGYGSFDEGFNKPISEMFYYSPEKREEILHILAEKGSVEDFEVQLKRKDGTPLWISTSSHFYRNERGEIAGVEGIFRDITERKRAEEIVHGMNTKITTLNSITRHNMINTLTGLLGMIAMAQDPSTRPELDSLLLNIKNLTEKVQEQIEFSRDYQAAGVQEPRWQSVREAVSSAARPFAGSGVSIVNTISGCEVYADPLLKKAFGNLIKNAVRNGGSLTTITFTERRSDTGLSIICEDNGSGIPADKKETLFEQYIGPSTNMGLFLVKEILSTTGITVRETGEPGKGARFEMTVPQGIFRQEAGSRTHEESDRRKDLE
jgi:PAS domain S-box-containing protein